MRARARRACSALPAEISKRSICKDVPQDHQQDPAKDVRLPVQKEEKDAKSWSIRNGRQRVMPEEEGKNSRPGKGQRTLPARRRRTQETLAEIQLICGVSLWVSRRARATSSVSSRIIITGSC